MDYEIVVAIRNLVDFLPRVYVDAGIVFVLVSLLKSTGLLKKAGWPQMSNALLAFLMNGGKMPVGDFGTKMLFMTMITAAFYYQVWKFASGPKPKKIFKKINEVMKKE